MENDNVVICPQGWAVNLSDIRLIGPVELDGNTHYKFTLYHKSLDKKHNFWYGLDSYADNRDELLVKIQNIRYEIIKLMNNGREVKQISATIKLKKKDG